MLARFSLFTCRFRNGDQKKYVLPVLKKLVDSALAEEVGTFWIGKRVVPFLPLKCC